MNAPASPRPDRRTLRFQTIDDVLADAERLVLAESEGRLTSVGNWSLGKTLGHLATWASFAIDGYPDAVAKAPAPVRWIGKLMKNRILTKGMMPGMKVGRLPGGTLGLDEMSADEGLLRLRAAMERLRLTIPMIPNPVFGPLTHEQWIQLNLRHAELHLSFQVPGS